MSNTATTDAGTGEERTGPVLMIEENQVSLGDLLLQDADFPDNYVHMAHPDDYKAMDACSAACDMLAA